MKLLNIFNYNVHPRLFVFWADIGVGGGLTFSKGAELIADGAEGLVFGQGSVVCNPTLHIYHHLLLLIHRDMLW